jgi:hypothetical protein
MSKLYDLLRPTALAGVLLLLAACGKHGHRHEAEQAPAPASVAPRPPFPAWAAPMIGKNLNGLYADGTACKGHFDAVTVRHSTPPAGVEVGGWAWDTAAMVPVDRLLFIDHASTIVGAGVGGVTRPDVPQALHDVTSQKTGWSGTVNRTDGKVKAVALIGGGKACEIGGFDLGAAD